VDAPVEGELERPPVEASAASSVSARSRRYGGVGIQDVYFGAHSGDGPSSRVVWVRESRGSWPQCLTVVADVSGLDA
jgi:hypothetical protein